MRLTKELIEEFLAEREVTMLPLSLKRYRENLYQYYRHHQELTKKHVLSYLRMLKNRGLRPRTLNLKVTILRSFSRWCWREGYMPDEEYRQVDGIPRMRVDAGHVPPNMWALTEEQIEQALHVLQHPLLWMLFWTGVHYGLRNGEYLRLKVTDVNLRDRVLLVREAKGMKTRRIRILREHVPVWENWLAHRKRQGITHEHVFFTKRGRLMKRNLERYFSRMERVLKDRGVIERDKALTSHTLRYSFGTRLWREGVPLAVISKLMGHASVRTTERYLKITEKEILEQYEAIMQ